MSPSACCERVRMWSINCCKLLKRRAELEARLLNSALDILCLQETRLYENIAAISITGFKLIGRLDKVLGPTRGFGRVAIFARASLADIGLIEYIVAAERMWWVLHTNLGALLIWNCTGRLINPVPPFQFCKLRLNAFVATMLAYCWLETLMFTTNDD